MNNSGTSDFFMKWFSDELLPSLSETHVIVMDNASFHPKKKLDELCIEQHHFFLPLPPYSPELNPIETAWANLKKAVVDPNYSYCIFKTVLSPYPAIV